MLLRLRRGETIVFLLALVFYAATMFPESPYNEQVRQAYAFLHGHVQMRCQTTLSTPRWSA